MSLVLRIFTVGICSTVLTAMAEVKVLREVVLSADQAFTVDSHGLLTSANVDDLVDDKNERRDVLGDDYEYSDDYDGLGSSSSGDYEGSYDYYGLGSSDADEEPEMTLGAYVEAANKAFAEGMKKSDGASCQNITEDECGPKNERGTDYRGWNPRCTQCPGVNDDEGLGKAEGDFDEEEDALGFALPNIGGLIGGITNAVGGMAHGAGGIPGGISGIVNSATSIASKVGAMTGGASGGNWQATADSGFNAGNSASGGASCMGVTQWECPSGASWAHWNPRCRNCGGR